MRTAEETLALTLAALNDPQTDLHPVLAEAYAACDGLSFHDASDWVLWLNTLALSAPAPPPSAASAKLLELLIERLHQAMLGPTGFVDFPTSIDIEAWLGWYRALDPQLRIRGRLLVMLARGADAARLKAIGRSLAESPLPAETESDLLFATLMQSRSPQLVVLFPALLDVAASPAFAAGVLDLANFVVRAGLATTHPAHDRMPRLTELLGRLVVELERIEQNPAQDATLAQQHATILATVPLAVALCDAIALDKHQSGLPKLVDAMQLGHRRLRCEAAWALAQFGDERGVQELQRLAAEPVARRRVLTYLDELGAGDQVDPRYRTDAALAEADLALWLSEPSRMGLAPTDIEVVDSRWLAWPGYDEPVHCHLLRFTYDLGQGRYINTGFAGPEAQAVTADLTGLSEVECYALFAGLQADHEEIQEFEIRSLSDAYAPEIARLERRMRDADLELIEPERFGLFFGERVLAARAARRGATGIAVADSVELIWNSVEGRRPLGMTECMAIYRGRKLLGAFNDDFAADEEWSES
ncbi:MAG: HEAT repeat domain-containing protein [Planctomycetales bacterium]|nr:HEAT repeat domain-containing protein [Planctomycetales bacterium]